MQPSCHTPTPQPYAPRTNSHPVPYQHIFRPSNSYLMFVHPSTPPSQTTAHFWGYFTFPPCLTLYPPSDRPLPLCIPFSPLPPRSSAPHGKLIVASLTRPHSQEVTPLPNHPIAPLGSSSSQATTPPYRYKPSKTTLHPVTTKTADAPDLPEPPTEPTLPTPPNVRSMRTSPSLSLHLFPHQSPPPPLPLPPPQHTLLHPPHARLTTSPPAVPIASTRTTPSLPPISPLQQNNFH